MSYVFVYLFFPSPIPYNSDLIFFIILVVVNRLQINLVYRNGVFMISQMFLKASALLKKNQKTTSSGGMWTPNPPYSDKSI